VSATNYIPTRILGAYPGDAVPIEEAGDANGVFELARRYGYGDWSDCDDDDVDEDSSGSSDDDSEEEEDDFGVTKRRKRRRKKKRQSRRKKKKRKQRGIGTESIETYKGRETGVGWQRFLSIGT